jgi:prevent-host-death family protein
MLKKITAVKARANLGQLMNEVAIKEDDYIIERDGKPLVAIIPIGKYNRLEEEKNSFFKWVNEVRDKNKDIDSEHIEKAISKAVKAVRKK